MKVFEFVFIRYFGFLKLWYPYSFDLLRSRSLIITMYLDSILNYIIITAIATTTITGGKGNQ